jgi:hypothetical protein
MDLGAHEHILERAIDGSLPSDKHHKLTHLNSP